MGTENEPQANILCKACGLCCTGHLFLWVRLKASELDRAQALGLNVIRTDPRQRGFTQPCPLWLGQCTIYATIDYPRVCGNYQCNVLKKLLEERSTLTEALAEVDQAKIMIRKLAVDLQIPPEANFREQLVSCLESTGAEIAGLRQKAEPLVQLYENVFGVKDLVDKPTAE